MTPKTILTCDVKVDDTLLKACDPFDYKFDGRSAFELPDFKAPARDGKWSIGLIVGPSGSGKSQLLARNYGLTPPVAWNSEIAIVSHFNDATDATARFGAVGLNSVPTWCRPFHLLSNGEQFRANLARLVDSNTSFDEFTSVVDRNVAKACSFALQRWIRSSGKTGVVFSSCHYDIAEWLMPDWIFDTQSSTLTSGRSLCRRPDIRLTIKQCDHRAWGIFKRHHYMSESFNRAAKCFVAYYGDSLIGFTSALPMPSGTLQNAWREHRTVILPDFQGLGLGVRLSDWLGEHMKSLGKRFYSLTVHPRMGEYRNKSSLWRATSSNGRSRNRKGNAGAPGLEKTNRFGRPVYSHEYIGARNISQKLLDVAPSIP